MQRFNENPWEHYTPRDLAGQVWTNAGRFESLSLPHHFVLTARPTRVHLLQQARQASPRCSILAGFFMPAAIG